ncbi:nucleotide pyrophosphohydrolase [Ramlibacter rhizophilus]|uniref:Nucleotide pyrophosphohydrolase n=1 Tax=Ramlibacter rhizophilus TaxID=1781167 RepID=A0A4Z0BYG3_9BURK|nr:nucleotide pyrophosphohydrolase [Ramlibacter rhizophilus]TFZ04377.1 nucleotide pyrophosphohydrolase [Ramlibacter rhizophilus]
MTSPDPFLIDARPLMAELERFAAARDWARFHAPKNLVMALTGEVGELSEIFQWLTEDESRAVAQAPATAQAVREEIADVLLYLVRLAAVLEIDLDEAVRRKMALNARKYPAPGPAQP